MDPKCKVSLDVVPFNYGKFGGVHSRECISRFKNGAFPASHLLVGGFSPTPLKNMLIKLDHESPGIGVKIKNI